MYFLGTQIVSDLDAVSKSANNFEIVLLKSTNAVILAFTMSLWLMSIMTRREEHMHVTCVEGTSGCEYTGGWRLGRLAVFSGERAAPWQSTQR